MLFERSHSRDRRLPLGALLVLLAMTVGCGPSAEPWNVLLVTFDTARADHFGCYGDARARTPTVDALAAEGTRFAHAYTAVPITAPSHSTILTGKYPIAHGFRDNGMFILGESQETLAEILRAEGYATAAAIGSFPLTSRFGLDQGFDLYDDHVAQRLEDVRGERVVSGPTMYFDERPAGWVVEALAPWLEAHHDRPFFAWTHFFDPHHPHEPPAPYDQLFADDLYRGEIAYADESLGKLLEQLRRLGVYERTLVVVVADHGEGNGEHEERTHSLLIYDGTLRVPLVMRAPGGRSGTVVEPRVGTVDIVPTILDLLGLPIPEAVQGRSLAAAVRTGAAIDPVPLYAETLSPRLSQRWGELRGLIDGRFKYIFGPRPELFDLEKDPGELVDLTRTEPDRAESMQRQLARFLRQEAAPDLDRAVTMDEETRQRLLALGYLHAGGGDPEDVEITEELRPGGIAPQDRVADVSAFSLARQMVLDGFGLQAREVLLGLLSNDPDNPSYLEMMVTAELLLGRLDAVEEILERLERLYPGDPRAGQALLRLAGHYLARGDLDRALARASAARGLGPTAWGLHLLATIEAARGDREAELAALEEARSLDPTYAPVLSDLAVRQAQQGDRAAAERAFRDAIAAQPYYARTHFNFGAFLVGDESRLADAAERFARAATLEPNYWQAHHAAASVYAALGDAERASEYRRRLETLAKADEQAATALAELTSGAPG